MDYEIQINENMIFADEKYQIYDLIADENIKLRQLESGYIKTNLDIKLEYPDDYKLVLITNSVNSNEQINVRNMFLPIYNNSELKICIYNNSNFKGLSINKGDVVGAIVIGF